MKQTRREFLKTNAAAATAAVAGITLPGVQQAVADVTLSGVQQALPGGGEAIRFRLATAGRSFAQLDLARCTGCGACVAVCPAGAVTMQVPGPAEAVA